MSGQAMTPEERFATLVEAFDHHPAVLPPGTGPQKAGFGSSALRVHDRIFAMLARDRLVVKLPKARVDALVASGDGVRFDPRLDGRQMKEWLSLEPASAVEWLPLATEALEFVAAKR